MVVGAWRVGGVVEGRHRGDPKACPSSRSAPTYPLSPLAVFNGTHPAMGSVVVQLVPTVQPAYNATLTPGFVLSWNVVGSRLDFQAVYSGVAWCVHCSGRARMRGGWAWLKVLVS